MKNKVIRLISTFLIVILALGIVMPMPAASAMRPLVPPPDPATLPFVDMPPRGDARDAIAFGFTNRLTNGMTATRFEPNRFITRADFSIFLYRLEGEPALGNTRRLQFSDVTNRNSVYYQAVMWAADNGIVNGIGDGTFRPHQTATRQDIVVMLYRYAALKGTSTVAPTAAINMFPDRGAVSSPNINAMRWAVNYEIIRGIDGRLLPHNAATRADGLVIIYRYIQKIGALTPEPPPPPTQVYTHGATVNGVTIGPAAPQRAVDRQIWDFFRGKGLNPAATAGIMGNLNAESAMNSVAVERAHWRRIEVETGWNHMSMNDALYTNAVNDGSYRTVQGSFRTIPTGEVGFRTGPSTGHELIRWLPANTAFTLVEVLDTQPCGHVWVSATHNGATGFIRTDLIVAPHESASARDSFRLDSVGYGLSQWTFHTRKAAMYDFIKQYHASRERPFNIGCIEAQLEFFWAELNMSFSTSVLAPLRNTSCVVTASNIVLERFMIPAGIPAARGVRAGFSLGYLNRFS